MTLRPFSLLVKPASADCNLRCEYCFYLDRWQLYPKTKIHRMSDEVLEKMIASYMATPQSVYSFGWQGGEPTLMGVNFFRKAVSFQQKYGKKGDRVANGLQTNCTLIDDEFASFLAEYNFLLGVSIDGPADIHDKYRRRADGRGSHADVMRGLETLKRHEVEHNILILVNSVNVKKPREIYRYVRDELGELYHQYIPCVEFDDQGNPMPYSVTGEEWGDFLCAIFDEWAGSDVRRVSIRLFDSILSFMVEGIYTVCYMAGNCCQYFVVEYNGDIYPCDFFVEKERKLGNIMIDTWEQLQNSTKYKAFGAQKNKWNEECKNCRFLPYCSGDCLKHRIYCGNAPDNMSWLCDGWKKFYGYALDEFKKIAKSIIRERQRYGIIPPSMPPALFPEKFKIGRNDPCFCGSGKKYKKCHGSAV